MRSWRCGEWLLPLACSLGCGTSTVLFTTKRGLLVASLALVYGCSVNFCALMSEINEFANTPGIVIRTLNETLSLSITYNIDSVVPAPCSGSRSRVGFKSFRTVPSCRVADVELCARYEYITYEIQSKLELPVMQIPWRVSSGTGSSRVVFERYLLSSKEGAFWPCIIAILNLRISSIPFWRWRMRDPCPKSGVASYYDFKNALSEV